MKPYKEIEMKLNRDRFEIFAKEQGYKDGVELFETLGYSADEYEYYADGEYIDRDMLLSGSLCRTRLDRVHFFTTAHNRNTCVPNHGDDIAAMLADI